MRRGFIIMFSGLLSLASPLRAQETPPPPINRLGVHQDLVDAATKVGNRLGFDPEYLLAYAAFHTKGRFEPDQSNQVFGTIGLFGFDADMAERLETDPDKIRVMTAPEQIALAGRALDLAGLGQQSGRSLAQMLVALVAPDRLGAGDDETLFSAQSGEDGYNRYAGFDTDLDGVILVGEAAEAVRAFWYDLASPDELSSDFYDVFINGFTSGLFFLVEMRDGSAYMNPEDFSQLGFTITPPVVDLDGVEMVPLNQIAGLSVYFADRDPVMYLEADARLYGAQHTNVALGDDFAVADTTPSVLLSYRLGGSYLQGNHLRLSAEGRLSWATEKGLLETGLGLGFGPGDFSVTRSPILYTMYQPDKDRSIRIGEQSPPSAGGVNPMSFLGYSITSDFSFKPDYTPYPTYSFSGGSGLPGQITFLIDGNPQAAAVEVEAGTFQLDDLPVINGEGEIDIVFTDALGRQRTQSIPFFRFPEVYRKGVHEYYYGIGLSGSPELGYGGPMASTWHRYGWRDKTTLTGTATLWQKGLTAGAEANHVIGQSLVLTPQLGLSLSEGLGYRLAFDLTPRASQDPEDDVRWGISLSHQSANWRQPGQMSTGDHQRTSLNAFYSNEVNGFGRLNAAFSFLDTWENERRARVSVGLQRPVFKDWQLNVSLTRSLDDASASLTLSRNLGDDRRIEAGSSYQRNKQTYSVRQDWTPEGTSDSYSLAGNWATGGTYGVQGRYSSERDLGLHRLDLDFNRDSGLSAQYGFDGMIAWVGGQRLMAPDLSNGLAYVTTGDAGDIPVYLQNIESGRTDSAGDLILTGLNDGLPTTFSIKPEDVPFEYVTGDTEITVIPHPYGASRIDLSARRRQAAVVILVDAEGNPLPAGAEAGFQGAEWPGYVGRDGETYFEDLPDQVTLQVEIGDETCEASFSYPQTDDPQPTIGPVPCI
ncbi:fimbria/pilus outer membrane usher protein [Frigidibacter sp. SD6-1]|uniref:fimbria/pilus outer membrane usher protein n=1 Tax=Frigidibacter sp. SD6-1 TaxID=3032581 RepID=UPI0024DFA047|nr:fimbria/pilus outer membrane usher protein [Frigidibacter sp. SD6-1]